MNYNEILSNYKKYFNTDLNMLDESYTVIYSSNYINISYKYPVSEIINTTFYCNNDVIIPIWKNYYLSLNKLNLIIPSSSFFSILKTNPFF